MTKRKCTQIVRGQNAMDGAGVHLRRVLGLRTVKDFDPFLMLDGFDSTNPDDYIKGFPWHPHRGIETVTYLINGNIEHGDSLGNKGYIRDLECQWMTAGSGIIHQEMPKYEGSKMYEFQLWVNLPAKSKMIKPRYQDISSDIIPVVELENKTKVKVLAGSFNGIKGPVKDIIAAPEYLDIEMQPNSELIIPVAAEHTAFVYLFEGTANFDEALKEDLHTNEGALFGEGTQIKVQTKNTTARFILIAGKPIKEPIAWHGPIVMNTYDEIDIAFNELRNGSFIKS